MSTKHRLSQLRAFISLCLCCFENSSTAQVARRTGLSATTIRRLRAGDFSLCVRYDTVSRVGAAAGFQLDWVKMRMRAVA